MRLILHCVNTSCESCSFSTRLLHEQQVKVRSVEMHVSNLMTENDHLKQASKEKCNEFAQKIEEMEENHNAGCCRLKETYEKKIW